MPAQVLLNAGRRCCAAEAGSSPRCVPTAGARGQRRHARAAVGPCPLGRRQAATAGRHPATATHSVHPFLQIAAAAQLLTRPAERGVATPLVGGHQPSLGEPWKYDVLGLGQAIVDFSATVDESLLDAFNVQRGGRRVVTVEERGSIMSTLDDAGCPSNVSAGGSLANTLVAVSKLSRASGAGVRVAMAGSLGTDALGEYFNAKMSSAGVTVVADPVPGAAAGCTCSSSSEDAAPGSGAGATGTVMVLTTPDAQRSFLSFFPPDSLVLTPAVAKAVRRSRVVVIEGYLWEMGGALEYISEVVRLARAAGGQVVLTAGDPGVVQRHRDEILSVMALGVDVLFTNAEEAAQLVGGVSAAGASAAVLAQQLATSCAVAVVTDGSKGSYISAGGQLHVVPPHWSTMAPVDTCGAGDAYAAGVLFALLCGHDVRAAGQFAARCASSVISKYGPQLSSKEAAVLSEELPQRQGLAAAMLPWGSLKLNVQGW